MKNTIHKRCSKCLNIEYKETQKCERCGNNVFQRVFDGFIKISGRKRFGRPDGNIKIKKL